MTTWPVVCCPQAAAASSQRHLCRDNGAFEQGDGEAAGLRQLLAEAVQGLQEVQAPLRLLGEMQVRAGPAPAETERRRGFQQTREGTAAP